MQCLYCHASQGDTAELVAMYKGENDAGGKQTDELVRLYVMGDFYQVPQLKEMVMKTLFQHIQKDETRMPSISITSYAYEKLPEDSPLCRLLVDHHCWVAAEWSGYTTKDFPAIFLLQLAARYARLVNGRPKINVDTYELQLADYLEKKA